MRLSLLLVRGTNMYACRRKGVSISFFFFRVRLSVMISLPIYLKAVLDEHTRTVFEAKNKLTYSFSALFQQYFSANYFSSIFQRTNSIFLSEQICISIGRSQISAKRIGPKSSEMEAIKTWVFSDSFLFFFLQSLIRAKQVFNGEITMPVMTE
jgi:hypothetical protein